MFDELLLKLTYFIFVSSLLDTKHLCTEAFKGTITSTVLSHVYGSVAKEPFQLPNIGSKINISNTINIVNVDRF